ncbi:hemagglutinin [Flavobacterium psychrotolerans]|uniref:Peptidoglycan hydrolase n=2 Tax=Flavobacterium psychrotolerans TaxID=2169410 RepID=A0A2U1JM44_9FLAO|nr:hemagglutinin [Flavobacterium psychrotolerans]
MFKKRILLVIAISLVGCSTSQPVVRTVRTTNKTIARTKQTLHKKPNTTIVKSVKKPINSKPDIISKPIAQSPVNNSKTETNSKTDINSETQILEATTRVKVTTAMVLEYISKYKDIAKNNMAKYGIPSSIILGQGILESGAGTGPLSVQANNHFGIKCHKDWSGPSVKYDDDSAQECFRKYNLPNESYTDHAIFLTGRAWYQPLFKLKKDDYKEWAKGLKAAGYASDPKYPDKLIGIIERYQLNQYDSEVLGTEYVPVNSKEQVSANSNLYQVSQGDTLYSISKKFNISIEDLKRKNDISENAISIGQNLIIK